LGPKHLCSTRVASQIDGRKRPANDAAETPMWHHE
jgi:hypothetical protein